MYDELKMKLNDLSLLNRQHATFFMLTYACLGRVGEVLRGKYKYNPPIDARDIRTKITPGGKKLLTIAVLTEKHNTPRLVSVNRDTETWLTEPIIEYAKNVNEGPLFNYSTRWGQKTFEKYFGTQHIHLLRGWRATHLLQRGYREQVVMCMGGWKDTSTLHKAYDHSVIEDYEDEIE